MPRGDENDQQKSRGAIERLEDRMIPTAEPTIINVSYVNPDVTRAPGRYSVAGPARSMLDSRRGGPRFANRAGFRS
jgi:hypothetical protein